MRNPNLAYVGVGVGIVLLTLCVYLNQQRNAAKPKEDKLTRFLRSGGPSAVDNTCNG